MFNDRIDAGDQLADRLLDYRGQHPVILGLARGGLPVAARVAEVLDAPLDVFVVRKLGAPMQPEFGFGAIGPGGVRVLNEATVRGLGLTSSEVERIIDRESRELERRLLLYRRDTPPRTLRDRTVILVDDGIATGVTALAAIRSIQASRPSTLVLAVPVCAPPSASMLAAEVDDFVCLDMPPDFRAVGLWYNRFDQVPDDEVIRILADAARSHARHHPGGRFHAAS